ncbi:MAG TPA: hypothetical protein VKS21_07530 [Spirochaetota bacterium]|nr:hypothetical protein [Spirochaetota bacterium]
MKKIFLLFLFITKIYSVSDKFYDFQSFSTAGYLGINKLKRFGESSNTFKKTDYAAVSKYTVKQNHNLNDIIEISYYATKINFKNRTVFHKNYFVMGLLRKYRITLPELPEFQPVLAGGFKIKGYRSKKIKSNDFYNLLVPAYNFTFTSGSSNSNIEFKYKPVLRGVGMNFNFNIGFRIQPHKYFYFTTMANYDAAVEYNYVKIKYHSKTNIEKYSNFKNTFFLNQRLGFTETLAWDLPLIRPYISYNGYFTFEQTIDKRYKFNYPFNHRFYIGITFKFSLFIFG